MSPPPPAPACRVPPRSPDRTLRRMTTERTPVTTSIRPSRASRPRRRPLAVAGAIVLAGCGSSAAPRQRRPLRRQLRRRERVRGQRARHRLAAAGATAIPSQDVVSGIAEDPKLHAELPASVRVERPADPGHHDLPGHLGPAARRPGQRPERRPGRGPAQRRRQGTRRKLERAERHVRHDHPRRAERQVPGRAGQLRRDQGPRAGGRLRHLPQRRAGVPRRRPR